MEAESTPQVNLGEKYPRVELSEADAHAWVFIDKDTFELYPCKYPEIKDDEVQVSVLYTGVSRADVQGGREEWGECPRPKCPGQETIGRVTKIGKDVTERKVGDIIGIGPFINSCQTCEFCLTQRDNVCMGLKAEERDLDMSCFGVFDPHAG
jgi:D-arabinose 1-dehydrogenase-like Zn-dependent alcohol dehydrogenase